jgi:hypothetical protein
MLRDLEKYPETFSTSISANPIREQLRTRP